jgi:hypothetical protein
LLILDEIRLSLGWYSYTVLPGYSPPPDIPLSEDLVDALETLKEHEIKTALTDGRIYVDPKSKPQLVIQAKLIRVKDRADLGLVRTQTSQTDVRPVASPSSQAPPFVRAAAGRFAGAVISRYKELVVPKTSLLR